jgi:ribonuclease VapC
MTIFADASALVAIIARESDAEAMADCLDQDDRRLCSALSGWETVAGLTRSYMFSVPSARARVRLFLDAMDFSWVGIGEREFDAASEAYAQFGRGRHPAGLNMGDCFAYACARTNGARLLFKGESFVRADIEPAMSPKTA